MGAETSKTCAGACDTNATQPAPMKIKGEEVDQLRQLLEESAAEKQRGDEERAEAERRRDEERRAAAERAKQEAILAQQFAAAEQARRLQEAQQRAQEQSKRELERQRELQRQREEAALATAAAKRAEKDRADKAAVDGFLEKHGFAGVNEVKSFKSGWLRSRKRAPIHVAVELCDSEMVRVLVKQGADVSVKAGGKRAVDLAQKLGQENARETSRILQLLGSKEGASQ